MLIGNKIDKIDERVVSTDEGVDFAKEQKIFFYETSALTNDRNCVNKCFDILLRECVKKLYMEFLKEEKTELQRIQDRTKTISYKNREEKKGCC